MNFIGQTDIENQMHALLALASLTDDQMDRLDCLSRALWIARFA